MKSYIYRCKIKKSLPNIENLKRIITHLFRVNKYNAAKMMNMQKFENQWRDFLPLVTSTIN